MKTHIARSVFDTQARLEQAVSVDNLTRAQGTPWISANFSETLTQSLALLRESCAEHGLSREAFLLIQKQRRAEVDQLSRLVRDFFQVLRRSSKRLDRREALEALYKRPARVPQWASVIEWLHWANNIILGDAQAQAMGYPAMTNPSAAEIASVRMRASACEAQWSEALQRLKSQEQSLRLAREQATRTLRGLAMRLRETLAHEAPATRRELMRTFGFSFISTGAPDRQKPSGPSQLHDLIKPVPRTQADADPPSSETPSETVPAALQPAEHQRPQTPAPDPNPNAETAPAATAQVETPAQTPQTQAPPPITAVKDAKQTSTNEHQPKTKLSRRQKKAMRRAQRETGKKPDQNPSRANSINQEKAA